MKTAIKIIALFLLLNCNRIDAQCGLTINYSYLVGTCDTLLHNINIFSITGSSCTSFSILWENMTTAMGTQLDTGYHYVYITDCFGCETIDTFLIACVGWNGSTNINNISNKTEFEIYPNPSSELINIESADESIEKVFIYNSFGQIIKEFKIPNANNFQINIANFEKGIYFVKVESKSGVVMKKIVVE